MCILIVGGTGFLGGATAQSALAANHEVTIMTRFGRGVTQGATALICDRDQPLPDLRGQFDVVIDTCGYAPDMVTRLAKSVGAVHYVFVSSISVYNDMSQPGTTEMDSAPSATPEQLGHAASVDPALRGTAAPYGAAYGPLKRSCEVAAQDAFGANVTVIRLGLIVGPGDYTDRFTWWVRRCDVGGALPVPGPQNRPIQLIDVEDAANFMLHLANVRAKGTFNVTGTPMPLGVLLDAIAAETDQVIDLKWIRLSTFTDVGLDPWTDLPLILPDDRAVRQMLNVSTAKSQEAALSCRDISLTIRRTRDWDRGQRDTPLQCGMSTTAEKTVLQRFSQARD